MDKPFKPDQPSPFQGGFQPQTPRPAEPDAQRADFLKAASASTIKPFSAVDLAPTAQAAPGPGVSPFLENFQQSPFKPKEDFVPAPPAKPGPAPKPAFAPPLVQAAQATDMPPAPKPAPRAPQAKAPEEFPLASASSHRPRFFLTTTSAVEGHAVAAYLGVVAVELVIPKDLLFRNPAPYGELHRLKAAEDQLQKVREKALEELAERAKQLSADGVVGVSLGIASLDSVACLCSATGTAVKLA